MQFGCIGHVEDSTDDDEQEEEGEVEWDSENEDEYWEAVGRRERAERRQLLARVSPRLPPGWRGQEVSSHPLARHTKACGECGKTDWEPGELYFTDFVNRWGAEKLCEECIEGWLEEGVEETDSDIW
jgi:hypothetical protein